MVVQPGTRLGPYTVESVLGSGGMGEVYRAHDSRLHRVVALKTLSAQLESSTQAVERFEREARAAASLNHPNICTVYDVGTDPPFIAMELLEGETLQRRLERGPLDPKTAVEMTLALVDALDTAHGRGVLHRDIKPANIFLTDHGPKLLDFGLAKALPARTAGVDQATVAPESLLTEQGVTVGTVAYMSPEQLRGQPLDARSDLFSTGLVMYEMVTGRRAFEGDTSAVIAAAILKDSPVPPRLLRDDVPSRFEDIILKTIEKDPRDRTQTAAELRADLRRLRRDLESGIAGRHEGQRSSTTGVGSPLDPRSDAPRVPGATRAERSSRRAWGVMAAAGAALTLATVGYVLWPWGSFRGTPPNALLQSMQVSQVTVTGDAWRPSLSPDGKYVVYIRRDGPGQSLRMRQLGTDRDVEIVAAEPGLILQAATVTPDGSFVDFIRGKAGAGTLWRIPFLGGTPRRILDDVDSPTGWSPDGRRFAFARAGFEGSSALLVVDADGSNERTLLSRTLPAQLLSFGMRSTPSGQGSVIRPAWSPDGRTVAFIGFESTDGVLTRQAVFVDVTDGSQRSIPLREAGRADGIEWLDERHLILSLMGQTDVVSQFWVLSYPEGTWSRLTNDLSNYASFGISADRESMAVSRWDYAVAISVLGGSSKEPAQVVAPSPFVGVDLSWAGGRLLHSVLSPADHRPAVWTLPQGASNPEELITNASSPVASADGRTIVFTRLEGGRRGIWRADADGRNAVEITTAASSRVSLTPDGKQLVFVSTDTGTQSLWIVPIDGGAPRQLADVFAYYPAVSPDGSSVAFVSVNDQNRAVIATCVLPDCASRQTFAVARPPTIVQWTPDGRGVAYGMASNIWVQPVKGGAPARLTTFPEDGWRIEDVKWSADGGWLAFSRSKTTWDIVLFRGIASTSPSRR